MDLIKAIESAIGKKANINFLPLHSGDVLNIFADVLKLEEQTKFRPKKSIDSGGVCEVVSWFLEYYNL